MTNRRALAMALAVVAGCTLAAPHRAHAWEALFCSDGTLARGIDRSVTFAIVGCSVPDMVVTAVVDAVYHWNSIGGVAERLWYAYTGKMCSYSPLARGRFEIGVVPGEPLASNEVGKLVRLSDPCSEGGEMVGGAIYIRQGLSWPRVTELHDEPIAARETILHEFGHALGMRHDDTRMSLMGAALPTPKVGRFSATGNSSVWHGAETHWATDLNFMLQFHPANTPRAPDIAASPWTFESGNDKLHYDEGGEEELRCPGETVAVNYTTVNLGGKDVASVPVHIVMSTNQIISISDRLVRQTSTSRSSGSWGSTQREFVVPSLAPGLYHVGVIVDPNNTITEDNEFNNASETGLRVRVKGGC